MYSHKKTLFFVVWIIFISFIFNKYAYDIFELNTKFRILLKEGKLNHRVFDEKGLPISYSARIGEFQSPFYVVHYAIIYSENMGYENKANNKIWREDPSLNYWNVYPDLSNIKKNESNFKNSVDWLVENVDYSLNGNAHYLYNFDWPYQGFNNEGLESGWWSGLTDAYAIIPLLRAYEMYGDEKYYEVASDLYKSSLTNYEEYGSLTYLNGDPWIEEYMDQNITGQDKLPYVLNGMIYSTFGINAFESLNTKNNKNISPELFRSIASNIEKYDHNGWSHYDLYKNSNNIKYHLVHTALLKYLIKEERIDRFDKSVNKLSEKWSNTSKNPGFHYILRGNRVLSYYHFLILYLSVLSIPIAIIMVKRNVKK